MTSHPYREDPTFSPWQMYLEQYDSKIPHELTVNLAPTLNKITPLQKDTGWHVLGDVITVEKKVQEYIGWNAVPSRNAPVGPDTDLLQR
ncbi:hypothetical protein M422DRAFT_269696 [Sphaerobolus stellatus SS14]|uniref:Uncharacterized protein n=1 Tax=Sphaerobolus stellatus (strain SS14) TaxID=990650 RepID=A0A0C9THP0_SPHS4|nr:hypothetical protein M422DRAFT_269696 [Sphaerobolus stellatus SS14]